MDKMNPLTYNNCIKLRLMKGAEKRDSNCRKTTDSLYSGTDRDQYGNLFSIVISGQPGNAVFMIKYGAMYPPLIFEDAQYYRLITCIFLHFGIDHLMNNMVMLGALGWNLEKEIGSLNFC